MKSIKLSKVLLQVLLIAFAVVQLYPLLFLFFFSLKDNNEIYSGNVMGLPQHFYWSNYENALFNANVGYYLLNSIFVTLVVILVSDILACMVSYAIARIGADDSSACGAAARIYYVEESENVGYLSGNHYSIYRVCPAYGHLFYDRLFPDAAQGTGGIGLFGRMRYL